MNRTLQQGKNFTLDVENLGPIAKANIELRPLTVFLGPSNVGKSYLAILIYALHRTLGSKSDRFGRLPSIYRPASNFRPHDFEALEWTSESMKRTHEWLRSSSEDNLLPSLPKDVEPHIRKALENPKYALVQVIDEIKRCFNTDDLRDLVRLRQSNSEVKLKLGVHQQTLEGEKFKFEFLLNRKKPECNVTFGDLQTAYRALATSNSDAQKNLKFLLERYSHRSLTQDNADLRTMFAHLSELLLRHMLQPLQQNAYYFPAARSGIMAAHRVIVSALLQGASKGGLRSSIEVPALPGVMSDFLDQLYNLRDYGRMRFELKSKATKLADEIESSILKGKVKMEIPYEYSGPSFSYRPEDGKQDVPFVRVSSMVSELAPIVLYLRHLVRPGDTLIIEEPESHLHPAMQAELANELARIVRHGIRVIVTTHSDWFLEKIGNLVRRSEIPEYGGNRRQNGKVALRKDEVGAWLFKTYRRPKGSKVEEIKIDPDTGLYPTDYDEVSKAL